jgi:hypothetical protein
MEGSTILHGVTGNYKARTKIKGFTTEPRSHGERQKINGLFLARRIFRAPKSAVSIFRTLRLQQKEEDTEIARAISGFGGPQLSVSSFL